MIIMVISIRMMRRTIYVNFSDKDEKAVEFFFFANR